MSMQSNCILFFTRGGKGKNLACLEQTIMECSDWNVPHRVGHEYIQDSGAAHPVLERLACGWLGEEHFLLLILADKLIHKPARSVHTHSSARQKL